MIWSKWHAQVNAEKMNSVMNLKDVREKSTTSPSLSYNFEFFLPHLLSLPIPLFFLPFRNSSPPDKVTFDKVKTCQQASYLAFWGRSPKQFEMVRLSLVEAEIAPSLLPSFLFPSLACLCWVVEALIFCFFFPLFVIHWLSVKVILWFMMSNGVSSTLNSSSRKCRMQSFELILAL